MRHEAVHLAAGVNETNNPFTSEVVIGVIDSRASNCRSVPAYPALSLCSTFRMTSSRYIGRRLQLRLHGVGVTDSN